jgi:hypothetical protein
MYLYILDASGDSFTPHTHTHKRISQSDSCIIIFLDLLIRLISAHFLKFILLSLKFELAARGLQFCHLRNRILD